MEMKKLYAYIYREDGYHTPGIMIENNVEQIANLLWRAEKSPKVVITTMDDEFVLSGITGYIDYCPDKDLLDKLRPVIIPLQKNKKKPCRLRILGWRVSEENNKDKIMFPFIKEQIGIDLQE